MCGLAVSNQHASVLVLGPLAVSVLRALAEESLLSCQTLAELGGLWFLIGVSPHAALVVSARHPQQGSWGDLSSARGFLRHIFRAEYGTLKLGIAVTNPEGALERIGQYITDGSVQTMHLGLPMAVLGIGWALATHTATDTNKKHGRDAQRLRDFGVALATAWAFYVTTWHSILSNISLRRPMSRAVHARFWIQPNLLLCLGAGCGLGLVVNTTVSYFWRRRSACYQLRKRRATAAVSLLLPLVTTAAIGGLRWDLMDRGAWSGRSHGWTMHMYGQVSTTTASASDVMFMQRTCVYIALDLRHRASPPPWAQLQHDIFAQFSLFYRFFKFELPVKALLSALPERSLLLSHTDLDLNAARYLRGTFSHLW